jgi:DNA-binding NtrC family response regulator
MVSSAVIHVIDDDDDVRQSLTFSLTTAGFAVRAYKSAVAFLEALPDVQPGCVVSDVRMPRWCIDRAFEVWMDGVEVLYYFSVGISHRAIQGQRQMSPLHPETEA